MFLGYSLAIFYLTIYIFQFSHVLSLFSVFKPQACPASISWIWFFNTSLKAIQVCSLAFSFFVFTSSFAQSKKVVVDFFLPSSRFHWLFQEPAQDLTLFNFLKENCYFGWRTYNQLHILRAISIFTVLFQKVSDVKKIIVINDLIFLGQIDKNSLWTQWIAELLTRWFSSSYQIL